MSNWREVYFLWTFVDFSKHFLLDRRADVPGEVEGKRRGGPGPLQVGQRQVPPNSHQVLRGEAHLAHLKPGRQRRLNLGRKWVSSD